MKRRNCTFQMQAAFEGFGVTYIQMLSSLCVCALFVVSVGKSFTTMYVITRNYIHLICCFLGAPIQTSLIHLHFTLADCFIFFYYLNPFFFRFSFSDIFSLKPLFKRKITSKYFPSTCSVGGISGRKRDFTHKIKRAMIKKQI